MTTIIINDGILLSAAGINLLQVAAHEFGHSLGILHSANSDALMAPFYRGYSPNFKLHQDDINAVQSIYGTLYKVLFQNIFSR